LYEALYGARPFAGDSFEELRRAVVSGELAPRRSKSAGVPSYVEQALARGLAADPGARFAHMGALLSALTPKPHPLYRLSALGLIVALLLALGGLGDRALHEKKRRSCVQAEALPAGIWDEAQRREVRRAFLATAKPYSLAAWQKVEQLLSDYTASWVVERAEACHATRVRGEQPVEVMALRERCLDQRREELAALLEVFTHADAEVVENAVRAVQSLPSSAACADVAALRARHPPPERNDAREPSPLRGLKRELLQVEALQRAGKSASAAAQAQALVERARALGTRHLEALAWVQLGLAQGGQGSYDRAEQALRKGLLTAEASGDRVLCAQTWLHLANNALRRNRPLEVDEDLGHAAALAESLGGDGEFAARRLYLMAAREHTQAHYAAAAEHAQAALAAYEKLGRRTIEQSQAMWLLGVILEARGDYSAAADVLTRALRMVEAQLGPDHPQVTSYLNAIGSVKQNQGLPEDALPQYQRALRIKTAALGADHPDVGVQLSNQGMLLIRLGRLDEAQAALQRARGILEKSEGQSRIVLARTLKQIAKIHMQRRDYAQAAQSFERARALLVELLGPDHDDVARCLHDLSLLAMQRRQWALAAEQNRRALAIFERRLGPDHPHSAELYETLGEAYLQLGKFARAAAALTHAVIVMEKRKDTASELAGTRFLLARARWARNESGDRLAALALAGAAYAALPPDDENRSEIARWLARRQAG
jgi:tetratricopeptide (TPR) repeat protein